MAIGTVGSGISFSEAALAAELARLGLPFVTATAEDRLPVPLSPESLIAALAGSKEARLRLALIPLFVVHPEYAQFVPEVANGLVDQVRNSLVCYYTAAMLLQRKHALRLAQLGLDPTELPNLFGDDLELPLSGDVDGLLLQLAEHQEQMSGRSLNWYGTYGHALDRLIRRMELEAVWAKS